MDFGNTTILNGGGRVGETTVLNNASQQSRRIAPYLIRSRNHEEIAVNKPQFRIGKERSYVDYFIGDNRPSAEATPPSSPVRIHTSSWIPIPPITPTWTAK